jgi:hypothetical protein
MVIGPPAPRGSPQALLDRAEQAQEAEEESSKPLPPGLDRLRWRHLCHHTQAVDARASSMPPEWRGRAAAAGEALANHCSSNDLKLLQLQEFEVLDGWGAYNGRSFGPSLICWCLKLQGFHCLSSCRNGSHTRCDTRLPGRLSQLEP